MTYRYLAIYKCQDVIQLLAAEARSRPLHLTLRACRNEWDNRWNSTLETPTPSGRTSPPSNSSASATGEGRAELVDPAWVRMVAAADEDAAPQLAAAWIEQVGVDCGQRLAVDPAAVRAVRDLIHLCQLANREGVEVVHTWYL